MIEAHLLDIDNTLEKISDQLADLQKNRPEPSRLEIAAMMMPIIFQVSQDHNLDDMGTVNCANDALNFADALIKANGGK